MDTETVERVREELDEIGRRHGLEFEEAYVFGSRARDDYRERSDIDLLIVSPGFEGVAWNKRSRELYLEWDYDSLPTPEFICLTPEEFEEQRQEKPHIVRTAVEEGVSIA